MVISCSILHEESQNTTTHKNLNTCQSPLESTGQEWYRHGDPDEECIYQEYSEREVTTLDFIRSSRINASLIDASLPEENEETQKDQQDKDRTMAWKPLRPSALRTVCKSMYIEALISLLTAIIMGSLYILSCYLSFTTANNCEFHPKRSIPVKVQWLRSISDAITCVFLYALFFVLTLFLFRPYQLMGVKRKLILIVCLAISWTQLIEWFYKPWKYLIPSFLHCKKFLSLFCFL